METMDLLQWLNHNHELAVSGVTGAIIPTVLIPLTAVTVAITSLAGIIAGWFGIKLHTEGPKQFLEVLLKKRVLAGAIVLNLVIIAAYKGYHYYQNYPRFLMTIKNQSAINAKQSSFNYLESKGREHFYLGKINKAKLNSVNFISENQIPAGAFRSGVISGDFIFYGSDDGFIYEFDKKNLSIFRKFFVGTIITTRPIIFQGKIYVGEGSHDTHHARVYSFSLKTGEFLNSFTTKGHNEGQPLIVSHNGIDLMFVVAGKDGVYAINPNTMEEIWHQNDGHIDATVSHENGVIYTGTGVEKDNGFGSKFAVAYDFATGKKIWQTELPLSNWMHPSITMENVCYSLGEIYNPSQVGLLYCLNKKDGTPSISIPFESPLTSKPFYIKDTASKNEYIFLSKINGEVCGIDLNKKEKMWCQKTTKAKNISSFSSFDYDSKRGVLWYPSHDQGLYAFDPLSGKVIFRWNKASGQHYGSISLDDNYLYFMDIKGKLRKLELL